MAKKGKAAKATKKAIKRKTFRRQGVEAWNRALAKGLVGEMERGTFLFAYEKGVKAHQTQRDTDGKPSEKECKAAAKALERCADGIVDDLVGNSSMPDVATANTLPEVKTLRKLAAALRGGGR